MILRLGSKGERVRELQTLLARHGFWPKGQAFTTNFGPVTEKNVIDFQKARGLKLDGLVGPMSWSRLAETVKNEIKPVYTVDAGEDFSDPEDEMVISNVKEAQPTCPNIYELIKLIDSSNITRRVTRLVFHCTATQQTATVEGILRHWKNNLGWKNPGYHIIVKPDGSWTQLQDFNMIANGVANINSTSLHISYIGGVDSKGRAVDNRTEKQREVFETVYRHFKAKMPNLTFHGHYEFSNKACPSYNVKNWIESLIVNI
jgi:N-acetylmuramoyl-L-alanine amidase